ncbi:AraC family transcriptional regulator [Streptomyces sp. Ru73]|uniref:AraC family transcriptional regulator n=1 Tax=Streptomyces sp. Ru73 TaxID=2080748 RepID=UPI000CDDD9B2|nr:AraC family transcriptional regulator [Streptomyces sp. Ru73]POX42555.1 AraC family transcriptional regulator [Streptomyces sp. Ru73]
MKTTTTTTGDWDEAAEVVTSAYFPHELTALSRGPELNLSLHTTDLGPLTLGRIGWGADVAIDCDYPDAYEVNVPLSGHLESRSAGRTVVSGVGEGTIFPPDTRTPITCWSHDCTVVGVKFDRDLLERETGRVLAAPARPRALPSQIAPCTDAARSWLHFVRMLSADLRQVDAMLASELVARQMVSAITTGFILAVVPDQDPRAALRPRIVKRILDELHDDPGRPWTAADMAEVAGVSVRRLQEGFQKYVGASPTATLRDIRLDRVHAELADPDAGATVAEVAARWGFTHGGRFAAAYRRRFGVSPSETLRS